MSLKIVVIGGTKRAIKLFDKLVQRKDVEISYCIFMRGYEDEWVYADQLVETAKKHDISYTVAEVITDDILKKVKSLDADIVLGTGIWRTMIPSEFLTSTKYGYIGLHGSGLPNYRGWAGFNWYIINGEKDYVMRMFQLDQGVDSGPLIANHEGKLFEYKISLENEKHAEELLEEVYDVHVKGNLALIDALVGKGIKFIPQNHAEATFTCNRGPEDGEINWNQPTKKIFDFIRAQSRPYPGAFTYYNSLKTIIWKAKPRYDYSNYIGRIPGKVVDRNKNTNSVIILTSDGAIEVFEATQPKGGEQKDLTKMFNSVRQRCKSRTEAYLDTIEF